MRPQRPQRPSKTPKRETSSPWREARRRRHILVIARSFHSLPLVPSPRFSALPCRQSCPCNSDSIVILTSIAIKARVTTFPWFVRSATNPTLASRERNRFSSLHNQPEPCLYPLLPLLSHLLPPNSHRQHTNLEINNIIQKHLSHPLH